MSQSRGREPSPYFHRRTRRVGVRGGPGEPTDQAQPVRSGGAAPTGAGHAPGVGRGPRLDVGCSR